MQKPRHQKTPMQLWVADNRKRLGETPDEIARLTGVTTATVRAWESRGNPSEDAIRVLERHFGAAAPLAPPADTTMGGAALISALERQTEAITLLVARLDSLASQAIREGVLDALREAGLGPDVEASRDEQPDGPRG